MRVLQAPCREVGVMLGGIQAAVSQQFLHRIDVRSAIQEVRGERVPDDVRATLGERARLCNVVIHTPVNKGRIELSATVGDD